MDFDDIISPTRPNPGFRYLVSVGEGESGQLGRDGMPFKAMKIDDPKMVNFGANNVIDFSAGENFAVAIVDSGSAFGWGCNREGQFGHSFHGVLKRPILIDNLYHHKIQQVSCGNKHTAFLLSNGDVLLAFKKTIKQVKVPEKIKFVSCGFNSTFCIGVSGIIYKIKNKEFQEVSRYQLGNPAKMITCGEFFAVAITEDGEAFGLGSVYETDNNDDDSFNDRFYRIQSLQLEQITLVSANRDYCLALNVKGSVFGWGENDFHQIGIPKVNLYQFERVVIKTNPRIVSVSAGRFHSIFIDENGGMWASGDSGKGETFEEFHKIIDKPQFCEKFMAKKNQALRVSCGMSFSLVYVLNYEKEPLYHQYPLNKNFETECARLETDNSYLRNTIRDLISSLENLTNRFSQIRQANLRQEEEIENLKQSLNTERTQNAVCSFDSTYDTTEDVDDYRMKVTIQYSLLKFKEPDILNDFSKKYNPLFNIQSLIFIPYIGIDSIQNGVLIRYFSDDYSLSNQYLLHSLSDLEKSIVISEIAFTMKLLHSDNIYHGCLNINHLYLFANKIVRISHFGFDAFNKYKSVSTDLQVFLPPDAFDENVDYLKVDVYSFAVLARYILTGLPDSLPINASEPFVKMIHQCQLPDPSQRPSFDNICSLLEQNNYLILNNVNESIVIKNKLDFMKSSHTLQRVTDEEHQSEVKTSWQDLVIGEI